MCNEKKYKLIKSYPGRQYLGYSLRDIFTKTQIEDVGISPSCWPEYFEEVRAQLTEDGKEYTGGSYFYVAVKNKELHMAVVGFGPCFDVKKSDDGSVEYKNFLNKEDAIKWCARNLPVPISFCEFKNLCSSYSMEASFIYNAERYYTEKINKTCPSR